MAAKKVPSKNGKPPVKGVAAKKKPVRSSGVKPDASKAGSAKTKLRPYNKQWMDESNAKRHAWDRSNVRKVGEFMLEMSPLGATEPLYRAVTGKDLVTGKKTKNRLGDLGNAAALLTPIKGGKIVRSVRKSKQAKQMLNKVSNQKRAEAEGGYKGAVSAYSAAYKKQQKLASSRAKTKSKRIK